MKKLIMGATAIVLTFVNCISFAGSPAARQGDPTSQSGVITQGSPTVMINGMPAARAGDFASSTAVIGVPCIGGPILNGSPTVRINNLPAAREGDEGQTACGTPQTITNGSPTVLIGP